ncbi:MAG: SDR family oxidoreductase [Eubacteriales bacterium]|nr:SDR family oxidoreductase [Eubacteriales bacterium]
MDLQLAGKVAVISGGGTGIGRAIAEEYLNEGVQVVIFGRRRSVLEQFAEEARQQGKQIDYECLDITDAAGVRSFAERIYEKYGRLDIWINNAGIAINRDFLEFTDEDWDKINDINLKGVFHGIQIAGEIMKRQGHGVIVNASSFAALIPHANGAVYAATKAGVSSLTKTAAASLAPFGIRVIGYIPGMIVSEISEQFISEHRDKFVKDISLGRLGRPSDLAKPVVFLTSDAAAYISGCDIEITGGKFAVQDASLAWHQK